MVSILEINENWELIGNVQCWDLRDLCPWASSDLILSMADGLRAQEVPPA